ncbi:hypothetical protein PLESTF_000503100 [Pleodorina starrii]|nr:hypothetical protein PLESTF_000503100 [Pleodorina starrii]
MRPLAVPRRALRPSRGPTSTAAAPSAPKPRAAGPPRPRLRPPPPPLSWPDYPYTRSPVASACSPHDTAGLKLEALFQCVLHYPRAPPRLLRFLRREVPDDVEARLAAITATVECLAGSVGREVAVYLIRRSAWLVLQPAEVLAPRMEAVRRLLRLQPGPGGGGVTDLLRKNPNLLRMQEDTVVGRYRALQKALYDAVGFDEQQLRALIIKYPLILNFKHESVHSALMALRRLCSARPDWTAFYKALSPSQVAFFVRERVVTLLRLEYLLLTGGGSGMTLRDIMKTSNNSFNRSYGGFRSWMQARLARLRQRMAQARAAMEARSRAEGREVSEEELGRLAAEVQAQYTQAEQERFHREFVHRREAERRDMERRMEQRQRAIEEKMQQQRSGLEREGEEEEEEDDGQQRRRWQWQQQSQRSPSGGGGGGGVASGAAHQAGRGARPAGRSVVPPAGTAFGSDPLDRVTLGRVWQRPGSRVPHSAGPGHGGSAQRQHRQ